MVNNRDRENRIIYILTTIHNSIEGAIWWLNTYISYAYVSYVFCTHTHVTFHACLSPISTQFTIFQIRFLFSFSFLAHVF